MLIPPLCQSISNGGFPVTVHVTVTSVPDIRVTSISVADTVTTVGPENRAVNPQTISTLKP